MSSDGAPEASVFIGTPQVRHRAALNHVYIQRDKTVAGRDAALNNPDDMHGRTCTTGLLETENDRE